MNKKILFLFSLLILSLFSVYEVKASEGVVELRSTTGEDYRCWASSIFMQNRRYNVSMVCRELLYPLEDEIQEYIVWGTPVEGDETIKLGSLDFGKESYNTRQAFSNLFITTETRSNVKTPTGRVVMQGVVQPITFLDRPTTATPTPEEQEPAETGEEDGDIIEETQEAEEELTTRDKLILGLKRAGIVAFFALIALVGLIFVVTRSRG